VKRKTFSVLFALVLVLSFSLVTAVPAVAYTNTLELENKDGDWNEITGDGIYAMLDFNSVGPEFEYSLQAWGLETSTEYALIYYGDQPDPFVNWGGDNPGGIIETFTTDGSGNIPATAGSKELNMSLPCDPDINIDGAKIWLTPTDLLTDDNALPMIVWQPTRILFEHNLVTYTDTGSTTNLTVVVPDIVAISVSPTVINFGTLLPGETSDVFDITVDNIGTRKVDVDADVTGSSGDLFFDNLQLNAGGGWYLWSAFGYVITNLAMGGSETLYTKLPVPSTYTPGGSETASLIFEATAS